MTYNKNPQSPDRKYDPNDYHSWAKGFMTKRSGREYHPYTKKDFKFGEPTN